MLIPGQPRKQNRRGNVGNSTKHRRTFCFGPPQELLGEPRNVLMLFGLTETQQTLKNTVRKFLAAECPLAEVRKMMETETAFDSTLWTKMAEQRWAGIIFPEEHGGFWLGMVPMDVTLPELRRPFPP